MREEKKMSNFGSSTFATMKAAGAEVPVFIPGETNKRVPVAGFAGSSELPQIAVYGETTYAEVATMLDGGAQDNQPRSKCIPVVCVLPYDTAVPYNGSTYGSLTKGATLVYTGADVDGFHFAHIISHGMGANEPPVTVFVEAILNEQNAWTIKLRNSFQVAGLNVSNSAAVVRIVPGMSTTATMQIEGANNTSRNFMLLPASVTQGPSKVANVLFIGFDSSGGMVPCTKSIIAFAGMTKNGVHYPGQTPTPRVFTSGSSPDAGIATLDITVYEDDNDFIGANLRVGSEFLAITDPYDRTKPYSVGDYCITSTGLYRLKTPYTPPANFNASKWEQTTLIELITDIASHALQSVATDATLTGDGTSAHPLSVVGGGGGLDVVSHDDTLSGDGTVANPLSVVSPSARVNIPNLDARIQLQGLAVGKLTPHINLAYTKNGLSKISGYIEVTTAFTPVHTTGDKGGSQYWPSLFVIDITDYDDFPPWSGNTVLIDRINNVYVPIQFSKATVNDRTYLSVNCSSEVTVQIYNKEFLPYWM